MWILPDNRIGHENQNIFLGKYFLGVTSQFFIYQLWPGQYTSNWIFTEKWSQCLSLILWQSFKSLEATIASHVYFHWSPNSVIIGIHTEMFKFISEEYLNYTEFTQTFPERKGIPETFFSSNTLTMFHNS